MADLVGFVAPATIWAAEATYAKPRLARIQWDTRKTVGWSELAGARLAAVARVRPRRAQCCGARGRERRGATASWRHQKHGDALGCGCGGQGGGGDMDGGEELRPW